MAADIEDMHMSAAEASRKLEEVLPRMPQAAKEQESSRFLQWRLSGTNCDDDERDRIFTAALPGVADLAGDVFGNFVVQKLFERGELPQRQSIADKLQREVYNLSTHKYGCRVVQKMLEHLPVDAQATLVTDLESHILHLVEDMHGNHVVQAMVRSMPADSIDFVASSIADNAVKMATHMYGCRVIQRLVEKCTPDQLANLIERLLYEVEKLSTDKHGNYVVQCILEHGDTEDVRRIIDAIRKDFLKYARNKVASNVVEKCFQVSSTGRSSNALAEDRDLLYQAVLAGKDLEDLANDKFGNYAVQSIVKYSRGEDRETIRRRIEAIEHELRSSPTGKHILGCLKKREDGGDGD